MATYNSIISRQSGGSDALVPEPLVASIIQELPQSSAALSLMKPMRMSSKTSRQPVLDVLPQAYFVNGDSGLKQTTMMAWKGVSLVAEEIAAIVPIPEAYLDDADIPIWDEVHPRIAEAIGALIDGAVFFGQGKPSTWGDALVPKAIEAGNVINNGFKWNGTDGTSDGAADFAQTVASGGQMMAKTGYKVNGFAAQPGMNWELIAMRSDQGLPIYEPDLQNGNGGRLYGYKLSEIENGSWEDQTKLVFGDWNKAVMAVRQDMTYKIFTEGVISDNNGAVVMNLMQQDAVALRVVMRVAYATANPVTIMQPNKTIDGGNGTLVRWPFAVVQS